MVASNKKNENENGFSAKEILAISAFGAGFAAITAIGALALSRSGRVENPYASAAAAYLLTAAVFGGTYASQGNDATDRAGNFAKGAALGSLLATSAPVMVPVAVLDTAVNRTLSFAGRLGKRSSKEAIPTIILPTAPAPEAVTSLVQPIAPGSTAQAANSNTPVRRTADASTQVEFSSEIDALMIEIDKQITHLERWTQKQSTRNIAK